MTLQFKVLGYALWSLELDLGEQDVPTAVPVAAKATKWMSNLWLKGMMHSGR